MKKTQRKSGRGLLATFFGAVVLAAAAGIIAAGGLLDFIPGGPGFGVRDTMNQWLAMFDGTMSKPVFTCAVIVGIAAICFLVTTLYALGRKKPFCFFPALGAACAVAFVPFDIMLADGIFEHNAMTPLAMYAILASFGLLILGWLLCMIALKRLLADMLAPAVSDALGGVAIEEPAVEEEPVAVIEKEEEPKEEPEEEKPAEEPVPEEEVKEEEKPAEEVEEEAAPAEEEAEPEEEQPVEEKPEEEPVKEEEPVAEEVAPAEEEVAEEEAKEAGQGNDLSNIQRKPFAEKLALADDDLRAKYEELQAEARAYDLKGRVSNSGDTYHLGRKNYLKITIVGKTLRVYYALDAKAYAGSPIPVEDVSDKKAFADMPSLLRVKSDLSLRRAKKLIADMMEADGIKRIDEAKKNAPVAAKAPVEETKVLGKYEVYPEEDEFKYRLKANNGEILIVSNGYSTRAGAKSGIETLRKNVEGGVIRVVTDKNGYSQFRIFTANETRLVVSGEFYKAKDRAESAMASVKRFYATEKVIDLDEIPAAERREWIYEAKKDEDRENGKLELLKDPETDKWLGRLLASNGHILFVTANNYASKAGLLEAIENIKVAAAKPKAFRILKDKQDRYQFVVESGNGSVLVLGETYASADSAKSAAGSVLSFLEKAEVVDTTAAAE